MSTRKISVQAATPPFVPGPPVPPGQPPRVGIAPLTGTVVAGVPVAITVGLDPGTMWYWDVELEEWVSRDIVSYTEATLSLDSGQVLRDQRSGNFDRQFTITFPRRGTYQAVAVGVTSEGQQIMSQPLSVQVAASAPRCSR